MLIYFVIFTSKIIENAVSTLRIIVVANGKKKIGAILQGVVGLTWIIVTGLVIVDINKDVFKVIAFALGSMVGSYLGSIIEEKIALGTIKLICVVKDTKENIIKDKLNKYQIITLNEKSNKYSILIIILKRKDTNKISKIIKNIDKDSIIISEKAKTIDYIV